MNNKDVAVEINPLLVLFFTLELISMKIDLNHLNTHHTALEQDFKGNLKESLQPMKLQKLQLFSI